MTEQINNFSKGNYPIFEREPDLIFLDNASTTQKPRRVLQAMENFYLQANANIHRGVYELAEKADQIYEQGREVVAKFVGAEVGEIIFTKNATEAANLAAFCVGEAFVNAGDNVVVTELEHHANYLPWQEMAKRREAEFRVIRVKNELGELDSNDLEKLIDQKTKVIAVTGMSNVLGVRPDLKKFREKATAVGALLAVDCAQLASHQQIDLKAMGCDLAFFTGHKLYGPMGIGWCFIKKTLAEKLPPFLTGGGMVKDLPDQWLEAPAKFEAGTPNVAAVAGLVEALRMIEEIGWQKIAEKEQMLVKKGREILAEFPQVKLFGSGDEANFSSMIAFNVEGVHPHDLASVLAEDKICIRAGHHCAKPLLRSLGVSASARVSFAIYNEVEELEKLGKSVERAIKLFS
jgi:cysteine desulfurase/selenocysteine lyase